MQRCRRVRNQTVAKTVCSDNRCIWHTLLLATVVMVVLIAASPGQAAIGAEVTASASEKAAASGDRVVGQLANKPATETPRAKGPDPRWQPPPMPEPASFGTVNISPEEAKELVDTWGVELLGMRLTAAGMMLDFRFRVLDAEKALPLFDHRIKPHIVAERSNIKLPVPMAAKVGAFRPTNRGKNIKADKIYYMIFGNPDRHVKVGEKVTVVIGDFKVEHLMVN